MAMYYPQSPVTTTLTMITVEKAIAAIETAADEIPADDFISYSTILDVHLSYALEFFSRGDQAKLLQALENILKENDELARNIAWDLITVLLPFLDGPPPANVAPDTPQPPLGPDTLIEVASSCLFMAAYKGNPREVYLKLLNALSLLSFTPSSIGTCSEEEHTDEPPLTPTVPHKTPGEAREDGHRKFRIVIMLLTTIHSRLSTSFPSRFLSQSLTTLLRTFTRSVEDSNREDVQDILSRLLAFIDSVQPQGTKKKRRMAQPKLGPDGRPALPPRTSTAGSNLNSDISKLSIEDETEEAKRERLEKEEQARLEDDMQIRLLQSFLSHIVEVYILRCPSDIAAKSSNKASVTKGPEHPMHLPSKRGINLHLASRFLQSNKFLSGGVIEKEIASTTPRVWTEILDTAYQLSIVTKELQELCYSPSSETEVEEDEPKSPHGMLSTLPRHVEDIPLSKIGSLALLASRVFEKESIVDWKIRIFPEHMAIVHKFLTKEGGISGRGVLDAVLFLGAWALSPSGGGFGEVPEEHEGGEEGWLMYLQTFALLSATSASPLTRLLAHNHLSETIHAHPDEASRLAYIKDTLEHCPYESLKGSMIGILKSEISEATTTATNAKPNIFASPLVLEELSMFLFPDLSGVLDGEADDVAKWDWFAENYPVVMATGNLWLFLLKREHNGRKGVCGVELWGERIETRWAGRLKAWLDEVESEKDGHRRGMDMDVDIVKDLLERVEEAREQGRV